MKNILLVGGTGLQGIVTTKLFKERNIAATLFISSRTKRKNTVFIDVESPSTFSNITSLNIDLVVLYTVDANNHILRFCIDNNIDYLDITKTTSELIKAKQLANNAVLKSNVIFASNWMGTVVPALIQDYLPWDSIQAIKLQIYYSSKDKSGATAGDFMAHNADRKFAIYQNNKVKWVKHFLGGESHRFSFLEKPLVLHNFEAPDVYTLHHLYNIPTVESKITYGDNASYYLMSAMQTLRLFKILPLNYKKKLFHASGQGDCTAIDILIQTHENKTLKISMIDQKGQAHLTALATVLHIEQLIQSPTSIAGVYFAHQLYKPNEFSANLVQNPDIKISIQ